MQITRKSIISGITRTLELNVTQEQIDKWMAGMYIQDAMPQLNADEREFIKTGVTKDEWDKAFPEEETDGEDESPF